LEQLASARGSYCKKDLARCKTEIARAPIEYQGVLIGKKKVASINEKLRSLQQVSQARSSREIV